MTTEAKIIYDRLKDDIQKGVKALSDEDYIAVLEELCADCEAHAEARKEELGKD